MAKLRTWVASGAHRINRQDPSASGDYDQTDAVRIMDAWWPLLVKADLQPVLGSTLLAEIEDEFPINDQPGHGTSGEHLGSSWDVGLLRDRAEGPACSARACASVGALNRVYCGNGSLQRCRAALESSLRQAIAESPQQVYPADKVCAAGDQMCSDSIQFRAIGAITQPLIPWINRPTFQQADELARVPPGVGRGRPCGATAGPPRRIFLRLAGGVYTHPPTQAGRVKIPAYAAGFFASRTRKPIARTLCPRTFFSHRKGWPTSRPSSTS